ncbi:MAG: chemotaxis protein CheA [Spirochaetes bacterium]|nr:chemotaxis protein CheA [Spirochaetota bacterium]
MKKKKVLLGETFKNLLQEKSGENFDIPDMKNKLRDEGLLIDELESLDAAAPGTLTVSGIDEKSVAAPGKNTREPAEAIPETYTEKVVIDDIEIVQSFIEESIDHLQNIEEKILSLETDFNIDTVNDIFRSMHTMKGTSSYCGFNKIRELSHSLESVLDELREDSIGMGQELIDVLLEGSDMLLEMITNLNIAVSESPASEESFEIDGFEVNIDDILSKVLSLRKGDNQGSEEKSLITDEITEKFVSEAQDLLNSIEKNILDMESNPRDKGLLEDAFRAVHTIKGNAGFLGYGDLEKICMDMESILDTIRKKETETDPKNTTHLLDMLDSMNRSLNSMQSMGHSSGTVKTEEEDQYRPVGEILVDMGEATPEAVEQALTIQERKVGEILVSRGNVSEQALQKALHAQEKASLHGQTGTTRSVVERKDIRVDIRKLDKLFDLMGELITAEAMVIHNPELKSIQKESFSKAAGYLSKVTREMQEITMTVRMIPLEGLFNKMRRLVRDLSKKFDKPVDFNISGQDTEMDRNVIEEISDPLVHIIRNSIDHGIENVKDRQNQGKDPVGHVSLDAKYEGKEIWITIKDDGAGLNKKKILAKAEERGLLKVNADALKDEDIWKLIFEPGFSTAEKVSEVSGRGVGMDVVKRNIEKLRGKIDILSNKGERTEIILKIPLTLAIIDGITATVGSILLAFPLSDIREFHKADISQITNTDSTREVLRLREEIIPVIKLHEFFGTKTEKAGTAEGILVIIHANGKKAGVLVDDIVGYQQIVVKGLPGYMNGMRAVSGCSIIGNGEVGLIIDTGALLKQELNW